MKVKASRILPVLLLFSASLFAQTSVSRPAVQVLRNNDVLRMVASGMKPGEIIAKIVTSNCAFDTFAPVMRDLERRGVPDTVLLAMKTVPYGPAAMSIAPKVLVAQTTGRMKVPAGTVLDLEAAKAISSADVNQGDPIIFLVSRRVMVNGVLVIDRGAVARARVVRIKPASSWGRGGSLEFAMEDVVAVDGTRIPIELAESVKGANHTTAVTAAAIVTGAIVFPYASPAALIWALKKGDNAVMDQGTKFAAIVKKGQEVAGLPPEQKVPIYHSVEAINQQTQATKSGLPAFNNSFHPTPIGRP